ncbi:hypothetical protein CLIB1423_11S02454 [[Candida] railenensis]|uniref:TAFII28-like protein domain-containing protein n=1 Tax=[Candida] railenensis TaxID=45579 RepID=A0A9P0QQB9_9ASCO|nr:hypothetical protein CLIB1423_11S02454 [[Candida] railenensis]
MSETDESLSDVSLDEEDEELIWRVFYGDYESKINSNNNSGYPSDYESEEYSSSRASASAEPESSGLKRKREADDDDELNLSDIDDPELIAKYESLKSLQDLPVSELPVLNEEEKKRLIISSFTDEQMDKFESYRRMTVNKPGVKKVCNGVLGHSIAQNIAVVLAGLSKSFLGEIITRAMEIQQRNYRAKLIVDVENKKKQKREILKSLESGKDVEVEDVKLEYLGDKQHSLQPEHIREAWRLYNLESSSALNASWRQQGDSSGKMFR